MKLQTRIEEKLKEGLPLEHMAVSNESHMHAVPPNSETHFKLVLVSPAFEGKRQVARHQQVYALLAEEMKAGVHALALHTYTPSEWNQADTQAPSSPQCMGGSKHDGKRT